MTARYTSLWLMKHLSIALSGYWFLKMIAHLMASQNFICQVRVVLFTTCKSHREKTLLEAGHIYIWLFRWRVAYGIPGRKDDWEEKWEFVSVERSGGFKTRKQYTLLPYSLRPHPWIVYVEGERVGEERILA